MSEDVEMNAPVESRAGGRTRARRRTMIGVVLSAKGDKTIAVAISRDFKHPKYEKRVRRTKRYSVHDEKNEAQAGDQVEVMETRKLSKTKNWRLVRILKKVE